MTTLMRPPYYFVYLDVGAEHLAKSLGQKTEVSSPGFWLAVQELQNLTQHFTTSDLGRSLLQSTDQPAEIFCSCWLEQRPFELPAHLCRAKVVGRTGPIANDCFYPWGNNILIGMEINSFILWLILCMRCFFCHRIQFFFWSDLTFPLSPSLLPFFLSVVWSRTWLKAFLLEPSLPTRSSKGCKFDQKKKMKTCIRLRQWGSRFARCCTCAFFVLLEFIDLNRKESRSSREPWGTP